MYIKSIELEGFKTYQDHTLVNGFDPQFNAVTGSNGTGKSNLLDAIVFVLGMSNMSHFRVAKLGDLVNTQITSDTRKAVVTMTLDNTTGRRPSGYENCSEIVISRVIMQQNTNKGTATSQFLINGNKVPVSKVMEFFSSIKLNINNPNFLIMQGRITTVISMKPEEILKMLEEAAGTGHFELKKKRNVEKLKLKDVKMSEIQNIFNEMEPELENMRQQEREKREYDKVKDELRGLKKIYTAWIFYSTTNEVNDFERYRETMTAQLQTLHQERIEARQKMTVLEENIAQVQKQKEQEMGARVTVLVEEMEIVEEEKTAISLERSGIKNKIKEEERNICELERNIQKNRAALEKKKEEMAGMVDRCERIRCEYESDAKALEKAQKQHLAACRGKVMRDDGEEAGIEEQLRDLKDVLTKSSIDRKGWEMELEQCVKDLSTKIAKQRQIQSQPPSIHKAEVCKLEKEIADIKAKIKENHLDSVTLDKMRAERGRYSIELHRLQTAYNDFKSHEYDRMTLLYQDPVPGFDRSLVYGLVCECAEVVDEKFSRALQYASNGKMLNIIVDSYDTICLIIDKGKLPTRRTFLALDKVYPGKVIPVKDVRKHQEKHGADNVCGAMSLLKFDPKFRKVMELVFGDCMIAANVNVANAVCKDGDRCVTLDGDEFGTSGMHSGGDLNPNIKLHLNIVRKNKILLQSVEKAKKDYEECNEMFLTLQDLSSKLEMKEGHLKIVKDMMERTDQYRLQEDIQDLKVKIEILKENIISSVKVEKETMKKIQILEDSRRNIDSLQKSLVAQVNELTAKAEKSGKAWKRLQEEVDYDNCRMGMVCLENGIADFNEEIVSAKVKMAALGEELAVKEEAFIVVMDKLQKASDTLAEERNRVNARSDVVRAMLEEKNALKIHIDDLSSKIEREERKLSEEEDRIGGMRIRLDDMKTQHRWIQRECAYFGQSEGMYDFERNKPRVIADKINQLEGKMKELERTVNPTLEVNAFHDKHLEFDARKREFEMLKNDRKLLMDMIASLERKKVEALEVAFQKVNAEFGNILSNILRDSFAKLDYIVPGDITRGLKIKVQLGGTWKSNLTELSGGQRSLVALSFVLAMLMYNPAPIYILDEVDAALDPSHTQNIGYLLKSYFKNAQFIVVSLKDGMFNNANVIFKTSFENGTSKVKRICPGTPEF